MRKLVLTTVLLGLASCGNSMASDERETVIRGLTPRWGEFVWHVREKGLGGRENRHCFGVPHDGRVLYWPSKHRVAFSLSQGDHRKTYTAIIAPKSEHEIKFIWNQISETISLMVDGKPPQEYETVLLSQKVHPCPF